MRSHVFPVCRPSFNKLDVETIDESRTLPFGPNNLYQTTGSDGTKGVANFSNSIEKIAALYFIAESDGGEYLLSDISNPSETTLEIKEDVLVQLWAIDSVNASSNQGVLNVVSISGVKPSTFSKGSIFCIGSKPSTDIATNRNLPNLSVFSGFDATYTFDVNGFGISNETTYSSGGNVWVTVMFTGTRFVILGSNSWY